jgi:crossover junction endodeoxyribonuclease RuvC
VGVRVIHIGIDTGLTGAIAVIRPASMRNEEQILELHDMPTAATSGGTVKQQVDGAILATQLRPYAELATGVIAVVERTQAMPKQNVSTTFSMGVSRGVVLGVLGALRIPYQEVAPPTWKRHFGLIGADKDMSRGRALRLYPSVAPLLALKKHHNRAEALLLAHWLRSRGAQK